ncbi:GFA family protein [Neptuniibacter sp. CAU 1671]|uniref:GFA family protein n=1 Tax=Neptuniibacter sp. CAU 1671 TaxID=3032593 RepID=UPI0023D982DF|nr:GFA family protein [Neptuniibacter sp. CAU 1671]MDF2181838.1 GFA family protein [Neptuniibacter sp. CAU 1671]
MSKVAGSCLCGNVHYSSDAEPVMVAACHCTDCQKETGSAFTMNVAVPSDTLKISGDGVKDFVHAGTSGHKVARTFCSHCGSSLRTQVEVVPGVSFIMAGTLDDPTWVKPGLEIWCDSKLSWATLGDDIPKVPGQPQAGD